MTLSDKIQICSIIASSIISTISIVIAALAIKQTKKITEENNKANILFFIDKHKRISTYSLVIKNFGKSGGKLLSLDLIPKLSYKKTNHKECNSPILTECKNIYLAPNQLIAHEFPFKDYPDKKFEVTIKYKTLGKYYTESYTIDLSFYNSELYKIPEITSELHALECINKSILEVSDKLM